MKLTVRVPATSANLGPGFDCFGLALDLCNEVTVDTDAEPGVTWEGEGAGELPTDGSDLISRTMAHVGSFHNLTVPPLHLSSVNRIPLQRGLGSSTAATVAGVILGSRLFDLSIDGHNSAVGHDPYSVFALSAEIEGHPDNAAAAAFGGFTLAMPEGLVHRLDPHPDLRPVVLIADGVKLPTARARRVLSDVVSRVDAVFNAAHAALMVEAITRDPSLLREAIRDRLHQETRLGMVPAVSEVFQAMRAADVPVCVSGSGPSLLAFDSDRHPLPDPGEAWTLLRPRIRTIGFEVISD